MQNNSFSGDYLFLDMVTIFFLCISEEIIKDGLYDKVIWNWILL